MPEDLKVVDLLGAIVGFLREAGLLGVGVAFVFSLYKGVIRWGRDCDAADARRDVRETRQLADLAETRADLVYANQRIGQLTVAVKQLTEVLGRATGGFERTVAHRIAIEEGVEVDDVLAAMDFHPSATPPRQIPSQLRRRLARATSADADADTDETTGPDRPGGGRSIEDRSAS